MADARSVRATRRAGDPPSAATGSRSAAWASPGRRCFTWNKHRCLSRPSNFVQGARRSHVARPRRSFDACRRARIRGAITAAEAATGRGPPLPHPAARVPRETTSRAARECTTSRIFSAARAPVFRCGSLCFAENLAEVNEVPRHAC